MNEVSRYILTIAGVILISIVVELVLSEGQMNRYIKSILSFFIIAVIIAPLPNLLSNENMTNIFENASYELQDDFIYKNNQIRIDALEKDILKELNEDGYKNLEIEIECKDMLASSLEYSKVSLDVSNVLFENDAEIKDKLELQNYIVKMLESDFGINREVVVYA